MRLGRMIAPVALCALLAACHGKPDTAAPDTTTDTASGATPPPAPPPPPVPPAPIAGSSVAARSDRLDFAYRWPELPGGAPGLAAWLAKDAADGRKDAESNARDDAGAARSSGYPFNRHSYEKAWKIEGATPALVSLDAALSEFTGGAHPSSGPQGLLWDRERDRPIALAALIADPAAARRAIDARYCPALDAERAKRRGAPVPKGSTDDFDTCPDAALSAVPAKIAGGAFTTLRILLDPYAAGPYVEGEYDIDVTVTPAFVAALKPEWRGSFRAP